MSSEFHINYSQICDLYAQKQLTGTLYLAFRDIPKILDRYSLFDREVPVKALDFGCGTGVSTRYLKSLEHRFSHGGIQVEGADTSSEMLELAQKVDQKGTYYLIQDGKIPVSDAYYDLIFSTFVLFEFATQEKMQAAVEELKRIMKEKALFIAVTGSAEVYGRENEWVSLGVNFPQNEQLKSGDLGRIDFAVNGQDVITFQNYYWTEKDYEKVFQKAGLHLIETLYPLGSKEEEKWLTWQWKSELKISPYYIFILENS